MDVEEKSADVVPDAVRGEPASAAHVPLVVVVVANVAIDANLGALLRYEK